MNRLRDLFSCCCPSRSPEQEPEESVEMGGIGGVVLVQEESVPLIPGVGSSLEEPSSAREGGAASLGELQAVPLPSPIAGAAGSEGCGAANSPSVQELALFLDQEDYTEDDVFIPEGEEGCFIPIAAKQAFCIQSVQEFLEEIGGILSSPEAQEKDLLSLFEGSLGHANHVVTLMIEYYQQEEGSDSPAHQEERDQLVSLLMAKVKEMDPMDRDCPWIVGHAFLHFSALVHLFFHYERLCAIERAQEQ